MLISVQLYSVREGFAADPRTTLTALKDQGFTHVEPFGLEENAPTLRTLLPELGLAAPTTHAGVLSAEDLSGLFGTAAEIGVETVIDPMTAPDRWQDADSIRAIAGGLNAAAEVAASHGITLGYHNHGHEAVPSFDGRTGLEVLADELDPSVVLEVDTYWARIGGSDPVQLLNTLADRVHAVHLKDGPLSGETAEQKPLGEGELDVDAIIYAARALDVPLGVIEFDDYAGEILEGTARSLAHLENRLGGGAR